MSHVICGTYIKFFYYCYMDIFILKCYLLILLSSHLTVLYSDLLHLAILGWLEGIQQGMHSCDDRKHGRVRKENERSHSESAVDFRQSLALHRAEYKTHVHGFLIFFFSYMNVDSRYKSEE